MQYNKGVTLLSALHILDDDDDDAVPTTVAVQAQKADHRG